MNEHRGQISVLINPAGTHIVTLEFMPIRGVLYGPDFIGVTATLWSRRGIQLGRADPEIIYLKLWSASPLLAGTEATVQADGVSFSRPVVLRSLFPQHPDCKGPFRETEIELNRKQFKTIAGATKVSIGDGAAWTHLSENYLNALRDLAQHLEPAEPFEGNFEKGSTYKAVVEYRRDIGWWPEVSIRILPHHAVGIEWSNLKNFPAVIEPGAEGQRRLMVFRVDDVAVKRMTPQRWNTTYHCTILEFERAL